MEGVKKSNQINEIKNAQKKIAPTFLLCGQKVRYSFLQYVIKLTNDRELAARFFLRAVENKARDITGWIRAGIGRGGWCWNACQRETLDPAGCRKWIDENISNIKPGGPETVGAAMIPMLEEMLARAKGQKPKGGGE